MQLLNNYLVINKPTIERDGIALGYINYLKALISLQSERDRISIYESFLSEEFLKEYNDVDLKRIIYKAITEIERDIVPKISVVSFFRPLSLK